MLEVENHEEPSYIAGLPNFQYSSNLTGVPYLSDYDIDDQLPQTIDSRYFTVSELSSLRYDSRDLSILHTNIRSLSLHHDELINLCAQAKVNFDIIGVSETWNQTQNEILTNVSIEEYNHYDTKSSSQNGGVRLYVKKSLNSKLCNNLSLNCDEFEAVWIEIDNKLGKIFLFCCIYRHPGSDIEKFTEYLKYTLPKLINKKVFMMGDFNINLLNFNSHAPTNDFVNTFFSYNFLPCINHPTRISHISSTIIDNIFTNLTNSEITCGNILTQISDHFPQFLILKNANMEYNRSVTYKHDYSSFDERSFISDFNKLELSYIDIDTDINGNYNKFSQDINILVEKHVPVKKCTKKESKIKAKPWINSRIQKMMRIRDDMFRKMKRNRSDSNLQLYRKFRNRVTNEIKKSKLNYFHDYFSTNCQNMKKLWVGIKSIISNKGFVPASVGKIKDKEEIISDTTKISNIFNEYFVNVAENITKTLPNITESPINYLDNKNLNSIFLSPVDHIEVENEISRLDSSKSSGPHSIPINLLKILGPYISNSLATLINQSFFKGIFPNQLKVAKVIPVFKKGDTETKSNYRPISLLPVFSKLYEKLMYKRLYSFITHNKIIYPLQFGFQENHSIDHALISMTEAIRNTLDNRKYGCGIFIDLQKAFDTVNHDILINKLEHYGIRGEALAWFRSYLSERHQFVSVNGVNSELLKIACGVPQGSVLGPLLFLIFINDLPNVSKKLNFYLFADDTNIYYESKSIYDLVRNINAELQNVQKWLDANRLSLNISKTNYIIFHSSSKTIPSDILIKIGEQHITRVNHVRFLGLLLDEHLSWKFHLNELSKKLARTCGVFFKIRHFLPTDSLICIYNSLFMSFLHYGIIVWGQTFASYVDPIFKLQKRAVRAISHEKAFSHSTPIFRSLKLLRLHDIFKLRLLTFVFESINKLTPSCFNNFFTLNISVHHYETRQSFRGDIYLDKKNTLQFGLKSIRYMGAKLWNDLPAEIRDSTSKFLFKKNLKHHLLNAM